MILCPKLSCSFLGCRAVFDHFYLFKGYKSNVSKDFLYYPFLSIPTWRKILIVLDFACGIQIKPCFLINSICYSSNFYTVGKGSYSNNKLIPTTSLSTDGVLKDFSDFWHKKLICIENFKFINIYQRFRKSVKKYSNSHHFFGIQG